MNQSFQEFTNGKYTTPEMVESLERATRYANLQIAIERVLCTYINETDASERLPITQIDFEHHGARVSVRVEIGEVVVREMKLGEPMAISGKFYMIPALAGDDEYMRFLIQEFQSIGGESLLQGGYLLLNNVTEEQFNKISEEVSLENRKVVLRVEGNKSIVAEHFRITQALAGQSENPVQAYDRLTQCDETCNAGCQCGLKPNSMYTSQEDRQVYGNG